MPKCKKCGKRGLFLRLNTRGMCEECELHEKIQKQIQAEQAQRKQEELRQKALQRQKETEQRLKKEEEERTARLNQIAEETRAQLAREEAVREKARVAFSRQLESIPVYSIPYSSEKISRRAISSMEEITYSRITKKTNFSKLGDFVVVDTETTGINLSSAKIVELSALRFENFRPMMLFTTLVNPETTIPSEATKVNHITDKMVKDAPKIWQIMPALQDFIGTMPLVGHNLPFDLKFLYKYGLDIPQPKQKFYDTLQIVPTVLSKPKSIWDSELHERVIDYGYAFDVEDYKLGTVCAYYGIHMSTAHRSSADCLATGLLFARLARAKTL
nr:exonuclease domain-containing protein [uncultured Butyricicoccus sp.]